MSLTPTQKLHVRESISRYCEGAFKNEPQIHYSQQRPFTYNDNIGVGYHVLDCSAFVGNCFWNAMHDLKVYLHDVCNYKYSGWGNTGSIESYLRSSGKVVVEANGYLVGDVARWGQGDHAHVGICCKDGTAGTARFASHGREAGPYPVELHYRSDFVGCWRHPALL